jgi:hypothetical protein
MLMSHEGSHILAHNWKNIGTRGGRLEHHAGCRRSLFLFDWWYPSDERYDKNEQPGWRRIFGGGSVVDCLGAHGNEFVQCFSLRDNHFNIGRFCREPFADKVYLCHTILS